MATYTADEELVIRELKKYVPPHEYELNDWRTILSRVERVKPNLYKYRLCNMELYFDDEMLIVEYGNVHIMDDKVYYAFDYGGEGSGTYEYIGVNNNA